MSDVSMKGVRIVLGKAGLDGHTNAIKLIAIACRDAGMEVIFAGIKARPEMLVKCAIEEDADLLGISCLSGAHMETARLILDARQNLGATNLKCIIGGIIPDHDVHDLLVMGIDAVIQSGKGTLDDALWKIRDLVKPKSSAPVGQL
jgi:methylmalonyl-CoA mutase C-terminal domain/subunit